MNQVVFGGIGLELEVAGDLLQGKTFPQTQDVHFFLARRQKLQQGLDSVFQLLLVYIEEDDVGLTFHMV